MFSSPPNFPTNRFLKSFYRYFCFSRREAGFTFTKDNICEILGKFSRYKINIFLPTEFSANESIFHYAYDQPEGKRKELFDPFSLFFEEQQRERKIWGDVSRVTGDIDYPKAAPAPRSRPSGLDAWNGFTGRRNPGRDRLIGKLIEKEYIRNTNRRLWLYVSWTKKKRKEYWKAHRNESRTTSNLSPNLRSIEGDRRIERALEIIDRGEEEETGNEATSKWMLTRETDRLLGATGGWKRLRIRGETRRAVFSTLFSCSPLKKGEKTFSPAENTVFTVSTSLWW